MNATVLAYDDDKFNDAAARYVEDGSPVLKAERQRDVDGVRNFLLSAAADKLRVSPSPPSATAGLRASRRELLPNVVEQG